MQGVLLGVYVVSLGQGFQKMSVIVMVRVNVSLFPCEGEDFDNVFVSENVISADSYLGAHMWEFVSALGVTRIDGLGNMAF